jgi:flagellar biosynthesis/type III secretory pathway protein FliH
MAGTPVIKLDGPIESVKVVETPTIVVEVPFDCAGGRPEAAEQLEEMKREYAQAIKTLDAITEMLQFVYEKSIVEYRQHIAKLAVEISRKILVQKVKEGDYQIESIVAEALKNTPTREEITIRLNPKDLARYQQIQQSGGAATDSASSPQADSVKFVADATIGPAECVVETPRGKIESLISEHLEQVERALVKAV